MSIYKATTIMNTLNKGDFVKIGNDTGVIVFLAGEKDTPNEHLGIWYGETNEQGIPKYTNTIFWI